MNPDPAVLEAVTVAAGGRPPLDWHRVTGGGYTPAERWIVDLDDGSRAFAKVATVEYIKDWLRSEHRAYRDIAGPFMPRLLGWADEPVPALLVEDLSAAHWPPPWRPGMVAAVLATLDQVATTPCPSWADPIEDAASELFAGWSTIAADPDPFLGLGLVTPGWLNSALPVLIEHQFPPELRGGALIHFDVRSDNICLTAERALLVDWNFVVRGNPLFDVAAWLPSLAHEGGPLPEAVSPEAGVFAPALAGYFCARAPEPVIPEAPHVRRVQRAQAATALPWAARWLGLPPPDGLAFATGATTAN
ncbi:MAG TPA: aminoglycoside phosphotransferase family protein [Candidatus Limnocylindria bacterium]|nr:aminoglycoside phosphotransferase family protein [Candidatus Limnocylindria bacterium]